MFEIQLLKKSKMTAYVWAISPYVSFEPLISEHGISVYISYKHHSTHAACFCSIYLVISRSKHEQHSQSTSLRHFLFPLTNLGPIPDHGCKTYLEWKSGESANEVRIHSPAKRNSLFIARICVHSCLHSECNCCLVFY